LDIEKQSKSHGVVHYKGVDYPGQHEPIISKETYDMAMALGKKYK